MQQRARTERRRAREEGNGGDTAERNERGTTEGRGGGGGKQFVQRSKALHWSSMKVPTPYPMLYRSTSAPSSKKKKRGLASESSVSMKMTLAVTQTTEKVWKEADSTRARMRIESLLVGSENLLNLGP
eukprot:768671-Hanusia_phi.AAC.5